MFEFWIQGWPRIAYLSDLEVDLSELPVGSKVELRMLKRLTLGAAVENMVKAEETERYVLFAVLVHGRAALRNMQLMTSDQSQAALTITLPEKVPDGAYQISVLQKVGGREMGHWRDQASAGRRVSLRHQCQQRRGAPGQLCLGAEDESHPPGGVQRS